MEKKKTLNRKIFIIKPLLFKVLKNYILLLLFNIMLYII